jgi:hypothetical protein
LDALYELPNLFGLDLNRNKFNTDLRFLQHLSASAPSLSYLDISFNRLYGDLSFVSTVTSLTQLYLNDNLLSGPLDYLASLTGLIKLDLANNLLWGSLSPMANLTALNVVDLSNNILDGPITSLTGLNQLVDLRLANNRLRGNIPSFDHFNLLQRLILSNNGFTGPFPRFGVLPTLRVLQVDGNQLHGAFSVDLTNMVGLVILNISFNHFNGTLPVLDYSQSVEQNLVFAAYTTSDYPFVCPFPRMPDTVIFEASKCARPWGEVTRIALYVFPSALCVLALYMFVLRKRVLFRLAYNILWWLFNGTSVVTMVLNSLEMIVYVSQPPSSNYCAGLNDGSVFSDVLLLPQQFPGTFDQFLQQQTSELDFSRTSLLSQTTDYLPVFQQFCQSIRTCVFNCAPPLTTSCTTFNPSYNFNVCYRVLPMQENATFLLCAVCLFAAICLNECLKLVYIALSLYRKRLAATDYVSSSLLCPLVSLAGIDTFGLVLLHTPSHRDLFRRLISQGLLQLAFLCAGVYFSMAVVQTDLSVITYVSLACCFFNIIILIVRALKEWCTFMRQHHTPTADWDEHLDLPEQGQDVAVDRENIVIFNYFSLPTTDGSVMDQPFLDHLPLSPSSSPPRRSVSVAVALPLATPADDPASISTTPMVSQHIIGR